MAAHRGGRRRPFKSPPPDWADGLPLDIMLCIFHRLGHVQIMMGADKVGQAWRHAAREEPELYRRIDMRGHGDLA
nr:unnamed protein product [Digitaria exilis]